MLRPQTGVGIEVYKKSDKKVQNMIFSKLHCSVADVETADRGGKRSCGRSTVISENQSSPDVLFHTALSSTASTQCTVQCTMHSAVYNTLCTALYTE